MREHQTLTGYADGGEELYDHKSDPHEWTNLAGMPEHAERLETMRAMAPADPAPLVRGEDQ